MRSPRHLLVVAAALLGAPRAAWAHPPRTSAVMLDVGERAVSAEMQLPLDQLALALDQPVDAQPAALLPRMDGALRAYVAAHVSAENAAGHAYRVSVRSLAVGRVDEADFLLARVTLDAPAGESTARFTLRDDVILHRVVTHKIFVSLRRDFRRGLLGDRPQVLGLLKYMRTCLVVDGSSGSWGRGFRAVFELGVRHIAEGADHVLFLLALLLPAPLAASGGRWRTPRTLRQSLRAVLGIVTAFTLGHSVTLVLGALGLVRLPARPVEVLIAVSVLVSALHAMRPIFAGREAAVAAGFGLVHGLAFASALDAMGFDGWALASTLLGFNLGIEARQLAIVALVVPWLVLLARFPAYRAVRVGGAAFAALAACGWIAQRALGLRDPTEPLVAAAMRHAPWAAAALAVVALGAVARGRVALGSRAPP